MIYTFHHIKGNAHALWYNCGYSSPRNICTNLRMWDMAQLCKQYGFRTANILFSFIAHRIASCYGYIYTFLISVYIYNVNDEITVCKFMIDYSCNHTSRESNVPMLRVKIPTFRPNPGPSSVNNDLEYKAG